MMLNIEEIVPIDCGEPVKGMQPAIIDVTPKGERPGSVYCPVMVDRDAGIAEIPVAYKLSFPDAFKAAIDWGERLKAMKSI